MSVLIHMEQVEKESLSLKGEISILDLDMETRDELIRPAGPLIYDITAKQDDESIILQGSLKMLLQLHPLEALQM